MTHEAREAAWERVRGVICGLREDVWVWLHAYGPATTAEMAAGLERPLLTVRPRVSELVAMGFVECTHRRDHEGVYQARTMQQARAEWELVLGSEAQLDLKLR